MLFEIRCCGEESSGARQILVSDLSVKMNQHKFSVCLYRERRIIFCYTMCHILSCLLHSPLAVKYVHSKNTVPSISYHGYTPKNILLLSMTASTFPIVAFEIHNTEVSECFINIYAGLFVDVVFR